MTQEELSKPRPFSPAELAKRWQCSKGLVCKMIRQGRLQAFMIGGLYRIPFDEVERYEKGQADAATETANAVAEAPRPVSPPRQKPQCYARGPQRVIDRLGDARLFA